MILELCLLALLNVQKSYATLPIEFLPNIHLSIKGEYGGYSPVHGWNLWKSGLLDAIKTWGGFGKQHEGFYSHYQLGVDDRQTKCPQNPLAAWVHRFYPLGAPNNAANDPIKDLPSPIIGMIIQWTILNQESLAKDNLDQKAKELHDFIRRQFPEGIKELAWEKVNQEPFEKDIRKFKDKFDALSKKETTEITTQILTDNSLEDWVSQYQKSFETGLKPKDYWEFAKPVTANEIAVTFKKVDGNVSSGKPRETFKASLAQIFLSTFVQSLFYEKQPGGIPGITIHTLWAYWIQKTTDWRKQFLEILEFAPDLKAQNVSRDFFKNPLDISPDSVFDGSLTVPYYAQEAFDFSKKNKSWPVPYGWTSAWAPSFPYDEIQKLKSHLKVVKKEGISSSKGYSNCREAALLSLLNILLYDRESGKINPFYLKDILNKTQSQLYGDQTTGRGLLAFYTYQDEKGNQPFLDPKTQSNNPDVDHLWSAMVTTHLNFGLNLVGPKIDYVKGDVEISGRLWGDAESSGRQGLLNMLGVMVRLLGIEGFSKFAKLKGSKWVQELDGFCTLFSRQDFTLSFDVYSSPDKQGAFAKNLGQPLAKDKDLPQGDLGVVFSVNYNPSFWLLSQSNHGQLYLMETFKKEEWRQSHRPPKEDRSRLDPVDLSWYVHSSTDKELLGDSRMAPVVVYQSLSLDNQALLNAIKIVADQKLVNFYDQAIQWSGNLNLEDCYTRSQLLASLQSNPGLAWEILSPIIETNHDKDLILRAIEIVAGQEKTDFYPEVAKWVQGVDFHHNDSFERCLMEILEKNPKLEWMMLPSLISEKNPHENLVLRAIEIVAGQEKENLYRKAIEWAKTVQTLSAQRLLPILQKNPDLEWMMLPSLISEKNPHENLVLRAIEIVAGQEKTDFYPEVVKWVRALIGKKGDDYLPYWNAYDVLRLMEHNPELEWHLFKGLCEDPTLPKSLKSSLLATEFEGGLLSTKLGRSGIMTLPYAWVQDAPWMRAQIMAHLGEEDFPEKALIALSKVPKIWDQERELKEELLKKVGNWYKLSYFQSSQAFNEVATALLQNSPEIQNAAGLLKFIVNTKNLDFWKNKTLILKLVDNLRSDEVVSTFVLLTDQEDFWIPKHKEFFMALAQKIKESTDAKKVLKSMISDWDGGERLYCFSTELKEVIEILFQKMEPKPCAEVLKEMADYEYCFDPAFKEVLKEAMKRVLAENLDNPLLKVRSKHSDWPEGKRDLFLKLKQMTQDQTREAK